MEDVVDASDWDTFKQADSWKKRGFALLLFAAFALLVAGICAGCVFAIPYFFPGYKSPEVTAQIGEAMLVISALAATLIMAIATGRPFVEFGFGGRNRIRNFLIGIVCGLAFLAVLLVGLKLLGVFTFGNPTIDLTSTGSYAASYAALFLAVAVGEETMFRGYAQVSLSRALSFWPAAILLGLMFGAAHLGNGPSESYMGAAATGLFGIVFAYSFLKTGSLWLAIGIHAGWDYAESFVFGVSDSGTPALPGAIFHPTSQGPDWLTGGTVGPEGSVLVIAPLLAIVIVSFALRRPSQS
jgi:hypothetical protein